MNRFIPKERNVGLDHNDLQSRIIASLALIILFVFSLPAVGLNDAYHRILLLQISLFGTIALAWGLVFGRKNVVGGLIAMTVPISIYLMPADMHRVISLVVTPIAFLHLLVTIVVRKCILNSIFSINSNIENK